MASSTQAAAPAELSVNWCGIQYSVQVSTDATMEELKRKIAEATGLPHKRQKVFHSMFQPPLEDNNASIDPFLAESKLNVVGLNDKDPKSLGKVYYTLKGGRYTLSDQKDALLDFDKSKTGLCKGIYKMGKVNEQVYILKGERKDYQRLLCSYNLLKVFRHPSVVALDNVYKAGGTIRLIFSGVDGTLSAWIKNKGSNLMMDSTCSTFTALYRALIIDLCAAVEKLIAYGLCPNSLKKENLYVKIINGQPRLKVLFLDVEPMGDTRTQREQQLKKAWDAVKKISLDGLTKPSPLTSSFCNFIEKRGNMYGATDAARDIQTYPDLWTDVERAAYLITVTSAKPHVKSSMDKEDSGLTWPADNKEVQHVIDVMTKAPNCKSNYNMDKPSDYVRLGKNLHKHYFEMPVNVKEVFGSKEGVLRKLESWTPNFWCKLYDAVGGYPA